MNFVDIKRLLRDKIASKLMSILIILFCCLILLIFFGLFYKSWAILSTKSLKDLLFSSSWRPLHKEFGLFPFIIGTFFVTGIAILLSAPICILTSIYISEYLHKKIQTWIGSIIDLLAGIPSVIYGIWGVLIVVPLIKNYMAPFFNIRSTGYCIFSGGIVLAIMIFPIIIHISVEILKSVPREIRDASLSLGATKWQTIKHVVLKKAFPGIIVAVVLGISRALGETMAVLMVVGNVAKIPKNLFEPGYPLTALIANNYGEMLSVPLYDSAIMFAALVLLLIVLFFNLLARIFLIYIKRKA